MMGNFILIGLAIFVTIMALIGYKIGMSKMIISVTFSLIVIVIVNLLLPLAISKLNNSDIRKNVYKKVDSFVRINVDKKNENLLQTGDSAKKSIIENLPLPKSVRKDLNDNCNDTGYRVLNVKTFKDYLVTYITNLVIKTMAYCILFVIVSILLAMIIHVLGFLGAVSVINKFDSLGGALFGIAFALLVIWIGGILVTATTAYDSGAAIMEAISENKLLTMIYDKNPLLFLLNSLV